MPSKKKQRAQERRAAKKDGAKSSTGGSARAAFVGVGGADIKVDTPMSIRHQTLTGNALGSNPNYHCKPAKLRSAPNLSVEAEAVKAGVMSAAAPSGSGINDRDGSSANNSQISPTLQRFATAYRLMDDLERRLEQNYPLPSGKRSSEMEPNVTKLSSDATHMTICVDLLRALALTDHRVGIPASVLRHLRLPECAVHVTSLKSLPAGSSSDVVLANVGSREFICLHVAAFVFGTSPHGRRCALRIVHELHTHAAWNYDWLNDFADLKDVKGSDGRAITEREVRFSLASVAIKVTRAAYRNGLGPSGVPAYLEEPEPSRRDLLASIEVFAREQIEFGSGCGLGEFNMGWVASQSPAIRHTNALEAAADCFEWMTKCYEAADDYGDDFLRSAARIEAAFCLVIGGGGIVGTAGGDIVERDFRSRDAKIADKTIKRKSKGDGGDGFEEVRSFDRLVVRADTAAEQKALRDAEIQRVVDGIPDTFLEQGAVLLIEPWEVRRLWNQAIGPFDELAKWNHSHFVYGESQGWQSVVDLLKETKNNAYNQYEACSHPGFPLTADGGIPEFSSGQGGGTFTTNKNVATCLWCGKSGCDFKRCTRVSAGVVL